LPYTPWSDNTTWSKLGVPGLLFMSLPDRYFHTQLLTVDQTDPVVFVHCGCVTGAAALVAATAGWPEAADIMRLVVACSEARLNQLALVARGSTSPARVIAAIDALEYLFARDLASMRSALRLVPDGSQEPAADLAELLELRLRAKASELAGELLELTDPAEAEPSRDGSARLIPRRTSGRLPHGVPGMSYPEMVDLATEMARHDPTIVVESLQLMADELWNMSAGQLDLVGIARAIGHEFGFQVAPASILRIAQGFERAGYLELSAAPV